jgi:hypothetical protein
VLADGFFTLSERLVGADILAGRIPGQDVLRSAFYAVLRERLGLINRGCERVAPLPAAVQATLA